MNALTELLVKGATIALASLFFGLRNNAPYHTLAASSLIGAVGYGLYAALLSRSEVLAFFAGTFLCCVLAEVFARILRTPTTVISIVAIIPLVPGVMLYNTMLEFTHGNTISGIEMVVRTLTAAGSMALAITAASIIGKFVISPLGKELHRKPRIKNEKQP